MNWRGVLHFLGFAGAGAVRRSPLSLMAVPSLF
jgi:hypothetical protein